MNDSTESNAEDADKELLGSSNSSLDLKKVKPPNKKKHEDEVEVIQNSIKEKERQLKAVTAETPQTQLKATRAEKLAVIEKLKKIDIDLKTFSQQTTKKKGIQDQLNSRLHYRSEDRIDEAIKRLKWQLQVQNFKLSEEKKVVAEIDSLNRSKKDLSNFQAAKKEVDDIRDRQRRMREERDRYQKNVNQLRNKEDELKKQMEERKGKLNILKREIDTSYGQKRQMIQEYRQQEKEYNEVKDEMKKQKKRDSFKRKEESKSHMEAFQNDIEEYGVKREPYEDEKKLCNTLINYLQKFQVTEEEVEEEVSKNAGGVVDELEGGKYILLKKTEDTEYSGVRPTKRRPSKKGKKFSVTKPITHAPQIFSQFASLMLNAPSTIQEIEVSLEQLQARKRFYDEGGPRVVTPSIEDNSASETGISATESAMCEMSRQASNTESTENPEVSHFVLDELVKLSNNDLNDDNLSEKSEDTLARSNSDSTDRTNSEADHSDLSSSSQIDQESRKGSDVSETEYSVFSSMSQRKNLSIATKHDEQKPNIPHSLDAIIPEADSFDCDKITGKSENVKPPLLLDDQHKLTELAINNVNNISSRGPQDATGNSGQGSSLSICDQKSISVPPNTCKSGFVVQSIDSQDDRFVVIDDNSNIHDLKKNSNDTVNEDSHIVFSTHL